MTIAQLTVVYDTRGWMNDWHKAYFKCLTNDKYPNILLNHETIVYPVFTQNYSTMMLMQKKRHVISVKGITIDVYGNTDQPFCTGIKSLQPMLDDAMELLTYDNANLLTLQMRLQTQDVQMQSAIIMMQDKGMSQDDIALALLDDNFSMLI